jgi:peptidoglycan biosynthesis protein MviN/MurJ (putative lipid II flippase)
MAFIIGWATAGHVVGRAVNVLTPLIVVGLHGAGTLTDRFFFIMALAFFFHGTMAHALTETTVPLIVSGRLGLDGKRIALLGGGCTLLVFGITAILGVTIAPLPPLYGLALALMAGAGVANGLAVGVWNAGGRYALPGLTWALRFLPLGLYMAFQRSSADLAWLAMGIAAADGVRCAVLLYASPLKRSTAPALPPSALLSNYGTILLAGMIMGVNPIINRLIAGLGGPGSLTILETGERYFGVIAGLATMGLMPVLLTYLSQKAAGGTLGAVWRPVARKLCAWCAAWLAIGVAFGYLGLQTGWLQLAALTGPQADEMRQVYWCYLAGLPTLVFFLAHLKRLQAAGRLRIVLLTAITSVALNVPLSLLLHAWMGIAGIALATTLVYAVACLMLWLFTRRYQDR